MNLKISNRIFFVFEIAILLFSLFCWLHFLSRDVSQSMEISETESISMEDIIFEHDVFNQEWNDSFPQRGKFSEIDSLITYYLCREIGLSSIIEGKEGWLFYQDTIPDYTGEYYYSEEELASIVSLMRDIENYFDERDISFTLTIVPNKNSIYSEYMPNIYVYRELSRTDLLVESLYASEINVIYSKELLLGLHTDYQLYYKYDTHWNQLGAYVAVRDILAGWNIILPPLSQCSISSYSLRENYHNFGDDDLARMAGIRYLLNDEIEYSIDGTYPIDWETINNDSITHIINQDAPNSETIVLIGDSFRASMLPSLCSVFSDVYVVALSQYSEEILEEISGINPDYVIMEFVEREAWSYLPLLLEMGVP